MTDARARVLSAITEALADVRGRTRPQPPVLDLAADADNPRALVEQFARELVALAGTCAVVADPVECASAVEEYLRQRAVRTVAVQSKPLAQDIGAWLVGFNVTGASACDKATLERYDCSLLEADALLADTGSAVVVLDNGSDRVLPYLPRTCVIVARLSALHATMSLAAIASIQEAAARGTRGEALIVAGPSRSADIEKILVLGAHGPQSLAVFIIENA